MFTFLQNSVPLKIEIYFILFLLLLLIVQFVLSYQYIQRLRKNHREGMRQMNDVLLKNQQVTDKLHTEIELDKHLIKNERIEILILKDSLGKQLINLEEQTAKITQSILYAKNIQRAILPPDNTINAILVDSFILYRPKDIVSGDYYWIADKGNKIVIAVADCTGHGVPGALMSMLGIAFLNEIINKGVKGNTFTLKSSEILDMLSEKITNSLHQTGQTGESRDGMDIALCIIDKGKQIIQFAGAFSPIYILKRLGLNGDSKVPVDVETIAIKRDNNMQFEQGDGFELIQVYADKRPVGIHYENTGFNNYEIDVKHNDMLYMFSDGFADQFGGLKGRKFSTRRFKNLLINNIDKSMSEQKEILDLTIDKWRGAQDQVDDILVMGIRLLFDTNTKVAKTKFDWSNKIFLVAEDDDVHFRYIKEILTATKVKLMWAKNGKEALTIYQTMNKFDLAIVDIHMPVMDGFELIKTLKSISPQLPVIVQAAYKMSNERERSFEAGCNDYLPKPINPEEFIHSICKFVK